MRAAKTLMRLPVQAGSSEPSLLAYEAQGSHRLEKYLNIQDCLEKSLKIKFALKSP